MRKPTLKSVKELIFVLHMNETLWFVVSNTDWVFEAALHSIEYTESAHPAFTTDLSELQPQELIKFTVTKVDCCSEGSLPQELEQGPTTPLSGGVALIPSLPYSDKGTTCLSQDVWEGEPPGNANHWGIVSDQIVNEFEWGPFGKTDLYHRIHLNVQNA
ncbi:hypothetical protein P7K49_003035 [Saguinus oedipus]|uniref:Uncharacterized protein n=1 Tax=Saguinus oedipus TaxID=9490 RepID=A0ABQ9WJ20_SAGOE|nr:hypothetical protein P7K49_003035 [Saguinus oedipus]